MSSYFISTFLHFLIGLMTFSFSIEAMAAANPTEDLPAANIEFVGSAYSNEANEFVYTEKHKGYQDKANTFLWIESIYEDPNGKPIAKKKSRFHKNRYVPDSEFEDFRFGIKETSNLDTERKLLHIQIQKTNDQNINNQKTSSAYISVDEQTVAGQGFNNYLVDFLASDSTSGSKKSKKIKFIILPKKTYYHFEVQNKEADYPLRSFLIQIDNFLLKKIVSPLKVTFKQNKIHTYEGLSNLESPNGKSQEVLIKYE